MSLRRYIVPIALAAFIPTATAGCFGSFLLTKKVYQFNQEVSPDKWIQWVAFLLMQIGPYPLAVAGDAVVANSIEFHTGENPIKADSGKRLFARGANGETASTTVRAPGVVDLEMVDADGTARVLTLVEDDASLRVYDAQGRLLGRVGDLDGAPALLSSR